MLSSLQDLSLACHTCTPAILPGSASGDLKTPQSHFSTFLISSFLCFIFIAIWPAISCFLKHLIFRSRAEARRGTVYYKSAWNQDMEKLFHSCMIYRWRNLGSNHIKAMWIIRSHYHDKLLYSQALICKLLLCPLRFSPSNIAIL